MSLWSVLWVDVTFRYYMIINPKKTITMKKRKQCSQEKLSLGKLLRSTGLLLPETEDEVLAFEKLYGSEPIELPEKLKNPLFLSRVKRN